MDDLVDRILDQRSRLELARLLLTQSAHAQPRPVAALVFLVDFASALANDPPPPAGAPSTSPRDAATLNETAVPSSATANSAGDSLEGASASTSRPAADEAAGAPSVSRRGSSAQRDGQAWWDAWREYLGEVYARPPTNDEHRDAATPPEHPSPLLLPPATLVHLRSALARPTFDPDTRSCLLSGCAGSLLRFLSPIADPTHPRHDDDNADADVCPALDMLMTQVRPSTFPAPLPSSTVSALALSLATTRTAPPKQRTEASRRTLATLLGHYVSRAAFGDILEADERAPSSSSSDRDLVLGVFPDPPPRAADAADEPHNDEDEDDADTRSIAAGIRDAHASIVRKDDKLRWLLGDNFQPGAKASSSSSSLSTRGAPHHLHLGGAGANGKVKAAQQARARELSGASTASSTTSAAPGDAIAAASSKRHQRLTSSTSSTAPLLLHDPADPTSSSSPTSSPSRPSFSPNGRTSFLHRRVLSAGNERIHAPPPAALLSTSLEDAAAAAPAHEPRLAASPARPFADLAPAVPHVRGASPGPGPALGPPSPTSPRRVSLDSALDAHRGGGGGGGGVLLHCDSLSAEQRRALVRRSKKLEGFFGAPFQESAAARVLVDRRPGVQGGGGGAGDGLGRDEVSPTNASFTVERPLPLGSSAPAAATASSGASTSTSSRRASLAPPGPTAGYAFGSPTSRSTRLDARRPSALSLSASSQGSLTNLARHPSSTSTTSPSLSPRSPTNPGGRPSLHRSSSSPSRGRRSSSFSSLADTRHTYFSERVAADRARDERDERRRKLDKVRRVLGERVPLALVVPGDDPTATTATAAAAAAAGVAPAMGRDRSRGGALRDRIMRRPHGGAAGSSTGAGGGGHAPEPLAGGGDAGWRYVEPQWVEGAQGAGEEGGETLKKGRPGLFGDLPPPALFLSQASPSPSSPAAGFGTSRPSFLATRQRRSYSDLSDLVSSPFAPGATAGSWLPPAANNPASTLQREPTRSSTVNSYRASIASLQYVMERDPGALDEVVRVYSEEAGSSGSRSAAEEEVDEEEEDDEDGENEGAAPGMRRSASTSSHRAVRQAQKLCAFFGTTRGEVWRLLLNDIEASVLDDGSLEDDERAEVLAGLERLRQSGPARF
ncbi:uncharacterized protein RHOBADRAFT_51986 [Rhodotorula graminis WP1]|uniref:Uncharacterized protein n=1 Tax=Rhodotorula graminis (strain WP1) TaxID=578459 RepID=A0A194S976_RHOGW|nr:uncharacterized protein RHOBADRAFT_51986 [Rhodotorula graminis WP1]KPV77020.1 hypothetical protein RHOBADRAFT_51986 [Rhodotorula graminis WP1]